MADQQPVNAWTDAEARYGVGQEVRGVVTRVAQFGVFVQVEPGIEGIVYAFELGQGPSALVGFAPGQEMQLYVKSVDVGKKRLELSLEEQQMAGLIAGRKLPPATQQKAQPGERSWPAPPLLPETLPWPREQRCPTCQCQVQTTWKYCVYCGGSLRRRCPACGSTQPDLPDALYCCECGRLLE